MATPLQANAVFTFVGFEVLLDGSVRLDLTCPLPGENLPGSYTVVLTPADVTTIAAAGAQGAQLTALANIVRAALIAAYRPPVSAIATRLSTVLGQTITV